MSKQPPGFNRSEQENVVEVTRTSSRQPSKKTKQKELRKKFPKLFSLRCWDMAQEKIKAGIAVEEVARWIQEEMLEYRDAKRESLVRALYRFKAELDPEEIVTSKPTYVDQAVEKMRRGINELEELEKLYLLQLKRISIDASTEEKINKLFKTTNQEITLASNLLAKRLELKMKLGLVESVPEKVNITQSSVNVSAVAHAGSDILQGLDEERKMKLGIVAEKLISGLLKSKDEDLKEVVETSDKMAH